MTTVEIIRIRGANTSARADENEICECKFRTARFPSSKRSGVEQTSGEGVTVEQKSLSLFPSADETSQRVAASLIIGLNVASADSDESSGFECSL